MMKKLFLSVFTLVSMSVFAQKNAISKYFSEYENREDFTQVQLTGKIFQMISAMDSEDEELKEAQQLFENVRGVHIIGGESIDNGYEMYQSAMKKLKGFELLMSIKEKDNDFSIMIDENAGVVDELVMIGGGDDNFVIIDVFGEIDLNQLSKVVNTVNSQQGGLMGRDHVALDDVEVYPNPVQSTEGFHIKLNDDMFGAQCKLIDAKGRVVWEDRVNKSDNKCNPGRLRAGVYAVEIEKDGVLLRKKLVVQ